MIKINEIIEIFKKAVEKWGKEPQVLMAIEEMSELSTELCHCLRGIRKINLENIIEEIADVEIMLDQLKFTVFDIVGEVEIKKSEKFKRLKERLEK